MQWILKVCYFQIMNYGVGGIIATHADTGTNITITEKPMYGGRRLMTFMMYLTDVELGGNTIFPYVGLSVKPTRGMALFWFNINSNMEVLRPQSLHMGCPVVRGSKWIANKWIKLDAQFKHYKCNNNHFSIL